MTATKLHAPKTIASLPLGAAQELRVGIEDFRRKTYLGLRKWFDDGSGALRPGKGLSVYIDTLPWLRAQLEAAEREAIRLGLLEIEDYASHDLPVPVELAGSLAAPVP